MLKQLALYSVVFLVFKQVFFFKLPERLEVHDVAVPRVFQLRHFAVNEIDRELKLKVVSVILRALHVVVPVVLAVVCVRVE